MIAVAYLPVYRRPLLSKNKTRGGGALYTTGHRLREVLTIGLFLKTNCCLLFGFVFALCDCLLEVFENGGSYVVKIF